MNPIDMMMQSDRLEHSQELLSPSTRIYITQNIPGTQLALTQLAEGVGMFFNKKSMQCRTWFTENLVTKQMVYALPSDLHI